MTTCRDDSSTVSTWSSEQSECQRIQTTTGIIRAWSWGTAKIFDKKNDSIIPSLSVTENDFLYAHTLAQPKLDGSH